MPSFLHSGDAGDAIYALPVIKSLGGGTIYFDSRPWTRSRFTPNLLSTLKGLFEGQEYIDEVRLHAGEKFDHDLSTFRNGGYKLGDTIMERQRRWLCAPDPDISKPWLDVSAAGNYAHRIAVNRAPRWLGFHFPWKKVVETFAASMLFLGLPDEYHEFCKLFGKIDYQPTDDFLEAARVIAGAAFFIGNQSACNAIGNGLHKATLLEVCPYAPDCFYPRDNVFYSMDGEVEIEVLGRHLSIPSYRPRNGWYIDVADRRLFSDTEVHALILGKAEHSRLKFPLPDGDLVARRYFEPELEFA